MHEKFKFKYFKCKFKSLKLWVKAALKDAQSQDTNGQESKSQSSESRDKHSIKMTSNRESMKDIFAGFL